MLCFITPFSSTCLWKANFSTLTVLKQCSQLEVESDLHCALSSLSLWGTFIQIAFICFNFFFKICFNFKSKWVEKNHSLNYWRIMVLFCLMQFRQVLAGSNVVWIGSIFATYQLISVDQNVYTDMILCSFGKFHWSKIIFNVFVHFFIFSTCTRYMGKIIMS